MMQTRNTAAAGGTLFTPKNFLLIAVALATVGAGYAALVAQSTDLAAVLLVAGYVVLLPLALVL